MNMLYASIQTYTYIHIHTHTYRVSSWADAVNASLFVSHAAAACVFVK